MYSFNIQLSGQVKSFSLFPLLLCFQSYSLAYLRDIASMVEPVNPPEIKKARSYSYSVMYTGDYSACSLHTGVSQSLS